MFAENASFLGLLCALGQGVAVAVHAALQNASQLLTYRPRSASPPPPPRLHETTTMQGWHSWSAATCLDISSA